MSKCADKFLMRTVRIHTDALFVVRKNSKKHIHTYPNIHTYVIVMHVGPVQCALSGDHIRLFGNILSIVLFSFFFSLFISFPVSFRIFMEKCPLSTGMINFHLDIFKRTHTHMHAYLLLPKFVVTLCTAKCIQMK